MTHEMRQQRNEAELREHGTESPRAESESKGRMMDVLRQTFVYSLCLLSSADACAGEGQKKETLTPKNVRQSVHVNLSVGRKDEYPSLVSTSEAREKDPEIHRENDVMKIKFAGVQMHTSLIDEQGRRIRSTPLDLVIKIDGREKRVSVETGTPHYPIRFEHVGVTHQGIKPNSEIGVLILEDRRVLVLIDDEVAAVCKTPFMPQSAFERDEMRTAKHDFSTKKQ